MTKPSFLGGFCLTGLVGLVLKGEVVSTPIYDEAKASFDLFLATARIEARKEVVAELRKVP